MRANQKNKNNSNMPINKHNPALASKLKTQRITSWLYVCCDAINNSKKAVELGRRTYLLGTTETIALLSIFKDCTCNVSTVYYTALVVPRSNGACTFGLGRGAPPAPQTAGTKNTSYACNAARIQCSGRARAHVWTSVPPKHAPAFFARIFEKLRPAGTIAIALSPGNGLDHFVVSASVYRKI